MPQTILDQQPRNGTFPSSSLPVPAPTDVNPDTGQPYQLVRVRSAISDADALDAGKACILYLRASFDGVTYAPVDNLTWVGGTRDRNGNPAGPSIGRSMPTDAGGNW